MVFQGQSSYARGSISDIGEMDCTDSGGPSVMTHFPVTALRSADLETPDIGRSEQFYTSVWGLDLMTRHEGVTYLRTCNAQAVWGNRRLLRMA